ncbi:MAG: class I SAM-dependent methyltransferase [Trebonia sp.]
MTDSMAINLANWEDRAAIHAAPNNYGLEELIADPAALSHVVRFDLPRLGELKGVRGVHLQCHIGSDTVSLTRLGASMVGLDFSPTAIAHARELAEKTSAAAKFVVADVYNAVTALGSERFDLVYVSIGALNWLPDVRRWAQVVGELLKPGGRLFIRDVHPVLFTIDDEADDDRLALRYPYFERPEPVVWDDDTTYIETDARLTATLTHTWNHGISEIVTAVLDAGMRLTMLVEHDSTPYNSLPGRTREAGGGEWLLADRPWRLPQTFTLQAVKNGACG